MQVIVFANLTLMISTNELNAAVLKEFVAALEDQNFHRPFIDQETIASLAQSIANHLQHPQQLMQKLKDQFQELSEQSLDLSVIDEPADKIKHEAEPKQEMSDDLEDYLDYLQVKRQQQGQNLPTVVRSVLAKQESPVKNASCIVKKVESNSEGQGEPDELSLEYEQECRIMELCKQQIKKSAQIHVSGVYNEPNKKYNAKQESTKLNSPFAFIKTLEGYGEFLAVDLNCVFKDGENKEMLSTMHSE